MSDCPDLSLALHLYFPASSGLKLSITSLLIFPVVFPNGAWIPFFTSLILGTGLNLRSKEKNFVIYTNGNELKNFVVQRRYLRCGTLWATLLPLCARCYHFCMLLLVISHVFVSFSAVQMYTIINHIFSSISII